MASKSPESSGILVELGYKNGPCRDGNLDMGLTLNRPNRLEG